MSPRPRDGDDAAPCAKTRSRALSAATTLAMLAGLLLVGAGVLKLGFLADFISHPVLAGFKAGTGLLIAVGQLGKVLGIEQTGDSFFEKRARRSRTWTRSAGRRPAWPRPRAPGHTSSNA